MLKRLILAFILLATYPVLAQNVNVGPATSTGSWTPVLSFGGGSTGIAYSSQTGSYAKSGNQVIAQFQINLTSKGSSTGSASIAGLPFTSTALGGGVIPVTWANMSGWSATAMFVNASATTINMNFVGATALTAMADTNFTNTSVLYGVAIYTIP